MSLLLLILVLALIWTAVSGAFSGLNLVLGVTIAMLVTFILRDRVAAPVAMRRLVRIFRLAMFFLKELIISTYRVSILALTPNLGQRLNPAIIAVPLKVTSDAEITLLANLITLTPGTLSVDVSENRAELFVHVLVLDTRAELLADIASGFEARIAAVFA
ncbi:Na+/H+ antiporter subunit E [Devosia rhodophyticola]|uniref:Na+/H+ antiporter subunit E n=1 Tax=Devosia rhodophyticola TaxID=3026423 RepID=A0ABY7YYJ2_9HYPH|nr:Na+/H+ antiporter subunit E [Devosia rhodophyticola]WDR06434.1 Na+/H+ antiporter subunit E [Devosia rhodophyticola]